MCYEQGWLLFASSFFFLVLDSPWRTSSGRQSDLNTGNCIHCLFREVMALVSGGPQAIPKSNS